LKQLKIKLFKNDILLEEIMKKTGYAIECTKCGSYNIKKGEPIANAQTNAIFQTLKCNDCGHESKETV
jgi:ribosomal protein S27E